MNLHGTIMQKAVDAGGKLRVRSALNPILWLCAIITIPCVALMAFLKGATPVWLVVLAFLPVASAVLGFLFLLCFDRDKLQSEDYQIRKRSLELIQQKGDRMPLDGSSIIAIANPSVPSLPASEEGGGE